MKHSKGFSLVELLVVIAVIGIIAAMLIPNYMAARRTANEGSAIASVRTISAAQFAYFGANGLRDFAPTIDVLVDDGYLEDSLLASQKNGYSFSLEGGVGGFAVRATPVSEAEGRRNFYSDESGIIRFEVDSEAGPDSSPLNTPSPAT